jgi:UDP-N-acetylmuramate--alanine ligase
MSFSNIKKQYPGKIHFIGIGGIGMSAIAIILKRLGCEVQGSDLTLNNNTKNLEQLGIKCFIGHKSENITDDICLIIETSIIKDNNPEIIAAKSKNIKIIRRADMLAILMKEKLGITIAGTHGKTSTTAMTSVLLETAGFDPMVINGGIINYFGSNAKFGIGKYLVAESDESDGSFVNLPSFIGAVTNIEPEHLEFYDGDFDLVKSFYKRYITQIPDDGLAVLCIDDKEVKEIYQQIKDQKKNIVTYGFDESADISASNVNFNIKGLKFDVKIKNTNHIIKDLTLPAYGIHNAKNSLVVVAIANFLAIDEATLRAALNNFSGVKRRFTKTGEVNGITIIDDYAHHPTEIQAVLKTARTLAKDHQVIAVFQAHKYTRVRDLFDEFCNSFADVDVVIVADIYSAGQDKIEGISQDKLIENISKVSGKKIIKLHSENDLAKIIKENAKSGDIVICVGAGTVTNWAYQLPESLKNYFSQN